MGDSTPHAVPGVRERESAKCRPRNNFRSNGSKNKTAYDNLWFASHAMAGTAIIHAALRSLLLPAIMGREIRVREPQVLVRHATLNPGEAARVWSEHMLNCGTG
jgi:hypothetical protein